jgi:hypothetical protein
MCTRAVRACGASTSVYMRRQASAASQKIATMRQIVATGVQRLALGLGKAREEEKGMRC